MVISYKCKEVGCDLYGKAIPDLRLLRTPDGKGAHLFGMQFENGASRNAECIPRPTPFKQGEPAQVTAAESALTSPRFTES